ncbi:RHS repeat-associated core domain-containing protein, partial [Pseudomonas sp. v388]|uniref:RHS repeat-associated core domain-containing protein n=1 Tax=Pseudomonas sp. v388 TaxID=2479849 RepID=UPI0021144539
NRTLNNEVRYLPGLEIRTTADGEILHVITAQNSRVLHWQAGQPNGIANDQIRYSLSDHLGSSTLELDHQGNLISQESYYPFGGTSWWAARSVVEVKYKTVRYSGKERDASGLYYYGFRYYAQWLQRWINPDPAGNVNGLNLFCFVGNTPVLHNDLDGRIYIGVGDRMEDLMTSEGSTILYRGLSEFPDDLRDKLKIALFKVHAIYKNAIEMIKYHPNDSADIMRSFFGYRHAEVTHQIIQSWELALARAAEYQQDFAEGKFVGFRSINERLSAFTYQEDPLGRVIINTRHIYSKKLVHTLGHELTHIVDILESPLRGPSAKDYYYIYEEYISLLTIRADKPYKFPYKIAANVITNGGLNLNYLADSGVTANEFIQRVRALHPDPDVVTDLNTAVNQFNLNPHIAANVSANNADSLMHAAYHLHKHYKTEILPKLQRQQARHSHAQAKQ